MADLLNKIGELHPKELTQSKTNESLTSNGKSFAELLKSSFDETNVQQINSEKAATDVATGQVKDLHRAAIALGKAESSMKLMLEIRNKAISAYKEILRTQM